MEKVSTENRAILKIAYTLATLNGEISNNKLEAFKQICFADKNILPGTEEANSLLAEIVSESQKLQCLKKFYSKKEFDFALVTELFSACKAIRKSCTLSRYAFAVWLGLSMADGKLEESDRQIIKTLQKMFSEDFDLDKYSKPNNKWLDNVPADNWLTTRLAVTLIRKYDNNIISDEFLNELEDNCKMLIDLKESIDAANDEGQKKSLQSSFDYIQTSLKEMIQNGLN